MSERSVDLQAVHMASFALVNHLIKALREAGVLSLAQVQAMFDQAIHEAENPQGLNPSPDIIAVLRALRPQD